MTVTSLIIVLLAYDLLKFIVKVFISASLKRKAKKEYEEARDKIKVSDNAVDNLTEAWLRSTSKMDTA